MNAEAIAPCLSAGPLSAPGMRFVAACEQLGRSPLAQSLRAACVPELFVGMEQDFAAKVSPLAGLIQRLEKLAAHFESFADSPLLNHAEVPEASADAVREVTGKHYGNLFKEFSAASYFDEPTRLLKSRLGRNNIAPTHYEGKSVLDAGCGGGRYTVAWRNLGAASCVGLDASEIGVADAQRRVTEAGITGVTFEHGDVLNLPYPDGHFDVVFSNGVLHHTTDCAKGIAETVRVLAPGGFGWLYLIESPGGVFWDAIEILRAVTHDDSREIARTTVAMLGHPANRVFYMLDHVMVPINLRWTAEQIHGELAKSGAKNIRRLERGALFDRTEAIYQDRPFAVEMFGVGEHRFVFSK